MKTSIALALGLSATLVLVGCEESQTCDQECDDPTGGVGGDDGGTGGSTVGSGGSTTTGAGGHDDLDWSTIITGDWELGQFSEITSDIHTITIEEDVYVGAIRPIAPQGTHHTVLGINGIGAGNMIYASGVGTNPIIFPPGVGLKIAAGQTLVLQLHLFNPSDAPISGTSGIEVVRVAEADIEQEANLLLPGPLDFEIPAMQEYTHTGDCTVNTTQNLFAVFPHMHQLGKHFKTTLTVGGTPQVLHDGGYEFEHQAFIPFEPITVNPGDTITTECTWQNSTQQSVGWGESSTSEMCFSIMYRYPAVVGDNFCDG